MMINSTMQDRQTTNKHILQEIVRAIPYLSKQGLPLRGHREQILSNANPGNFLRTEPLVIQFSSTAAIVTEWYIFVTKVTK